MSVQSFLTKFFAISFILIAMVISGIYLLMTSFPPEINESSEITTETARQIHPPLEFQECFDDVAEADTPIIEETLAEMFVKEFPDLELAKVGSYCRLNNQNKLVTYSYYYDDGEFENTTIYFNNVFGIIEYINEPDCGELGITAYPIIQSIDENVVTLTCTLTSSEEIYTETYHLYLPDLEVEFDKIETEPIPQ